MSDRTAARALSQKVMTSEGRRGRSEVYMLLARARFMFTATPSSVSMVCAARH